MTTPAQLITVEELAEHLQFSQSTIYRLFHQGGIPFLKIGSNYRFDADGINKWLADRQTEGLIILPQK